MEQKRKEQEEKEAQKLAMEKKVSHFKSEVSTLGDLHDYLQDLTDHLAEFTGASATYIGKVAQPINGISKGMKEDDNDQAHIIPKAEEEIQFIHASENAKFMVGKILTKDQGITFNVFNPQEKKDEDDTTPNYIMVPEVVREPKMFYYKVPRLGSYLAIQLEYSSCMFEEAFDAAIENYNLVNLQRKNQEREMKEFDDQQAEMEEEKKEAGEEYVREQKEWKQFNFAEFKTRQKQFVVCLNTMGQDREFS